MGFNLFNLLVGVLIAVHLIPIWTFQYFPTQDGPSHLETAYILLNYFDPQSSYRLFYDLTIEAVPNWIGHFIMLLSMFVLPPLMAQQFFLTVYVVVFILSIGYFLKSVGRDKIFFILFAFPLIYHSLLQLGFYNYSFGFPVTFFVVGYWYRRKDRWNEREFLMVTGFLLILLYFCHMVPYVVALCALVILGAFHYRKAIYKIFPLILSFVPSLILAFYYIHTRGHGHSSFGAGRLKYFLQMETLMCFTPKELDVTRGLGMLYLFFMAYTAIRVLKRSGTADSPKDRFPYDFLILTVFMTVLYFVIFDGVSLGQAIPCRLNFYPFVFILPCFANLISKPVKVTVAAALIGLSLAHLAILMPIYRNFDRDMKVYTSALPFVGKNETIFSLSFYDTGRVGIYRHAAGYYTVGRGAVGLSNYEANQGYFPLGFKPGMDPYQSIGDFENKPFEAKPGKYPKPVDNILLWNAPTDLALRAWIEQNYKLAYAQGMVQLYKRH